MGCELGVAPIVPEFLNLSLVGLGSPYWTCVALISARPIGGEIRHIMPHFLWRNPAQKTNLG